MTTRETDPEIVRLTERYPFEVISVAGSMAEHFTVAEMTDILKDEDLIQTHAAAAADRRTHFSNLNNEEYKGAKNKKVREELARSAFGYLADVRSLWHRGTQADLQDIA